MKKIFAALAILAVIAAGTAAALLQQLQPEGYESVDALAAEHKKDTEAVYQTFSVGEDAIVVLHNTENNAYSMLDIRKSGDGYVLKQETTAVMNELGFSMSFRYSKKETAVVTLTPDEKGKMVCSLRWEVK